MQTIKKTKCYFPPPGLTYGTAIATFPDGAYRGHAAIYVGKDSVGIQVRLWFTIHWPTWVVLSKPASDIWDGQFLIKLSFIMIQLSYAVTLTESGIKYFILHLTSQTLNHPSFRPFHSFSLFKTCVQDTILLKNLAFNSFRPKHYNSSIKVEVMQQQWINSKLVF